MVLEVPTAVGGSSVSWDYCLRGLLGEDTGAVDTVSCSQLWSKCSKCEIDLPEIRSYTVHLGRKGGVWDLRAYHSNPLLCFFLSWKTTNGWEKKAFWLQIGCRLGLLHHPMTSVGGLRKTQSGTRLLRNYSCQQRRKLFFRRLTAKASAYYVPGKPEAVHSSPWLSFILDKCTLHNFCAEFCFILHLLFRSTTTKKLPQSSPKLQGRWRDGRVDVSQAL